MLTSLLEGGLQEMVPDQGEFLSVHYDIRLVSNLVYGQFKVPERQEGFALLFSLSVRFFVGKWLQAVVGTSRRIHTPKVLVKGNR